MNLFRPEEKTNREEERKKSTSGTRASIAIPKEEVITSRERGEKKTRFVREKQS